MMSFLNLKHHIKKEKVIAILDIGSASVGGALVIIKENGKPNIIYSVRKNMVFQNNLNLERFLSSMLESLEYVLSQMKKSTKISPDNIFCIFSSSWSVSEIKKIKIEKTEAIIINEAELEKLIKKEIDAAVIMSKRKKIMEGGYKVIDIKNIQTKLNGYETSTPYNKKAKLIEIALFASVGAKKVIDSIKNKVFHIFHYEKIIFSSFLLIAFITIRDIFTDKKDFILLDITGEVTDVAIIRNNLLISSSSFPLGKNFLIRRMVSSLNTTKEEAISILNMYQKNDIDDSMRDRLMSVFSSAEKEWLLSFTKAVTNLSEDSFVPQSVFFTADDEVAEWFNTIMGKAKFTQFANEDNTLDITFLNEKILGKFCLSPKKEPADPFIIMEAIFAAKTTKA